MSWTSSVILGHSELADYNKCQGFWGLDRKNRPCFPFRDLKNKNGSAIVSMAFINNGFGSLGIGQDIVCFLRTDFAEAVCRVTSIWPLRLFLENGPAEFLLNFWDTDFGAMVQQSEIAFDLWVFYKLGNGLKDLKVDQKGIKSYGSFVKPTFFLQTANLWLFASYQCPDIGPCLLQAIQSPSTGLLCFLVSRVFSFCFSKWFLKPHLDTTSLARSG